MLGLAIWVGRRTEWWMIDSDGKDMHSCWISIRGIDIRIVSDITLVSCEPDGLYSLVLEVPFTSPCASGNFRLGVEVREPFMLPPGVLCLEVRKGFRP